MKVFGDVNQKENFSFFWKLPRFGKPNPKSKKLKNSGIPFSILTPNFFKNL